MVAGPPRFALIPKPPAGRTAVATSWKNSAEHVEITPVFFKQRQHQLREYAGCARHDELDRSVQDDDFGALSNRFGDISKRRLFSG